MIRRNRVELVEKKQLGVDEHQAGKGELSVFSFRC